VKAFARMMWVGSLFVLVAAASIDGTWQAQIEAPRKKAADGKKASQVVTMNLKSDGNKLTGTATRGKGKRGKQVTIEEGKIDGNQFSFVTVQKGKKGDRRVRWEGTLEGNEMKASMGAGKRSVPFTAKKM
jgi:hypothetical protein